VPAPLDLSLYLVTDPALCAARGLLETVHAAVQGGVSVVQLRDKQATDAELVEQGRALKAALAGTGVPLIINDRVEVAAAVGADGVHVGQGDEGILAARALLGRDAVIGLSIQSVEQARVVEPGTIDYVGIGPVFGTATKPDHARPLGFDGLAEVRGAIALPAVAIGGLKAVHVPDVLNAGCDGLAVVSAICGAADPSAAAEQIRAELRAASIRQAARKPA
jgi:thiamine-phosphate pyrophosphorylase